MKKYLFFITLMFITIINLSFGQSKIKAIRAGRLIDVVGGTMLIN